MRATYGAFTPLGSTAGFALTAAVAGLASALTTETQFAEWGRSIPFLLALPLTIFCLWIRTRVEDTISPSQKVGLAQASDTTQSGSTRLTQSPVSKLFRQQPLAVARSTAISAACKGTAYIGLSYMSIHLFQQLGYGQTESYRVTTIVIMIAALLMPVGGRLADRYGFLKTTLFGLFGFAIIT